MPEKDNQDYLDNGAFSGAAVAAVLVALVLLGMLCFFGGLNCAH